MCLNGYEVIFLAGPPQIATGAREHTLTTGMPHKLGPSRRVLGYSLGAIAAAVAADVLQLEQTLSRASLRGLWFG
jgi:acyl transferase domain-containing protein